MTSLKDRMNLNGRKAVITGGTGWLGSKMCEALLELNADVYAVSRGVSDNFIVGVDYANKLHIINGDLSTKQGAEAVLEQLPEDVTILINNFFSWPKNVKFTEVTWEDALSTFETGVVSPLLFTKAIFERMYKMRWPEKCSVINVSSMYANVSPNVAMYRSIGGNAIEYGAAKAALTQATRYLAMIGGKMNIRVNSISPGPFPRPGAFKDKEWFEQELKSRTMLDRVADADEIKGVIAFLASDMSSYVTGADIQIDGGWRSW